MTIEELKAEADKLGYILVKKKPYQERYLPCVCGCSCEDARFERGMTDDGYYYRTCPKCGFSVRFHVSELNWPRGNRDTKMKIEWNKVVAKQKENKE